MSNPTLDHAAEIVAAARAREDVAALAPVEQAIIDKALGAAPELDRRTVGAAWMILGNAIAQLANGTEVNVSQVVNLAQLAGQRLYTGTGLPREVRCAHLYSTGAQCKHVVTGLTDGVIDAKMQGHYATYHPDATWPPADDEQADADAIPQFSPGDIVWTPTATPAVVARLRHSCSNSACDGDVTLYFEGGAVFCYRSASLDYPASPYAGQFLERPTIRELIDRVRGEQEAERVVHLPRLDAAGNPTDYALCDNGERDVAPGTLSYAGPNFGKSDPTCATCTEIDENGEADPEQPALPHDVYMEAVSVAIEELGAPYDDHEYWTTTPDGESLDGVFTFQDDDVNPGQWPDGVVLQWSQRTGWQLCTKGENRTLFDLTVDTYANPRAVAVEARARLRHGMAKPLRDIGERSWDGAAATEAAVRAWEAEGRAADQATEQYFGELDYEKYREANPLPGDEDGE